MVTKTRKHEEEQATGEAKELETAYVVHTLAQLLASQLATRPVPVWPTWAR
jgi:hypothetical protein